MLWKKVLPPSFTLKIEAVDSFKMLITTYQCAWHQILKDCNLNIHCLENLKSHVSVNVLEKMCALEGHPEAIFVLNLHLHEFKHDFSV
jgi:hypothetical protein